MRGNTSEPEASGRIYRAVSEFDANRLRLCLRVSGRRRKQKTVRRVANRLSTGTNKVSIEEEPRRILAGRIWTGKKTRIQRRVRLQDVGVSQILVSKRLFSRRKKFRSTNF
jgi:hypothetical protein